MAWKLLASVLAFFVAVLTAAAAIEIIAGRPRPGFVPMAAMALELPVLYLIWRTELRAIWRKRRERPAEDGMAAYNRQDYATALRLWRPLADQGDASVQYNLGVMYANGHGVPQDYVRAHMWFNLAATKGDKDAVKNRDIAAAKMPPAQIAEAQKMAREWKPATP